jgi:hypothetical protein
MLALESGSKVKNMNSIEISCIVLACTFAGSVCGMGLRAALLQPHVSTEAKDLIKLGMGLIGTMTALVLGLLISSAKDSFDSKSKELTDMSTNVVILDRTLAHYGPETGPIRDLLHRAVGRMLDQTWSRGGARSSQRDPAGSGTEVIYDKIQALSPKSDAEPSLQSDALALAMALGKTRWLMFEQESNFVATPLLAILVCWLTVLFISFGLHASSNATVVATLLVCALVVSSAIWLILDMYRPFQGLIQISDTPLRTALLHLGQ